MEIDQETDIEDFGDEEEEIIKDHTQYKRNNKRRPQKPSRGSFHRLRYLLFLVVAVIIIGLILNTLRDKGRSDEQISAVVGEMAKVKNSLSDLDAQIKGLQESVTEFKNSNASFSQGLNALDNRLAQIENKYTSLSEDIRNSSKGIEKSTDSKSKKTYYEVKSGDTLTSIAKKNGISVEKLKRLNGIGKNQDILTGQKLLVK
jgi:LysM repeat protein